MSSTEQSIENNGQIQSDWNQVNNLLPDFIKNKPLIPSGNITGSDFLWLANVIATRNVVGGPVNITQFNYPINPFLVDGRSRRLRVICNYSKASGNSTIGFVFTIGGTTITLPSMNMTGAVLTNETFIFDIDINYRSGTDFFATVTFVRYNPNVVIDNATKIIVTGVWDKAIANTVDFKWQTISGTPLHTITVQQVTSELI